MSITQTLFEVLFLALQNSGHGPGLPVLTHSNSTVPPPPLDWDNFAPIGMPRRQADASTSEDLGKIGNGVQQGEAG